MKDSLKPFVEKCPTGCRADVLAYHPSKSKPTAANWPRVQYLETEPTTGGTWTATAVAVSPPRKPELEVHYTRNGHRLHAVELPTGQLAGARRSGVDLHEPHANYCSNGGRKPRK